MSLRDLMSALLTLQVAHLRLPLLVLYSLHFMNQYTGNTLKASVIVEKIKETAINLGPEEIFGKGLINLWGLLGLDGYQQDLINKDIPVKK